MGRNLIVIVYVLVMVALIIGLDVAFLRDHLWLRLAVNVGVVVIFAAGYYVLLRRQ
ncbi:MAG: hypothetical protein WBA05_00255 [Gordonia sp. (in: high G+C Gram-positive bacteria)]|uniref:hypothetical protein n=1 Tax=Gordonia sp. (in: high G+C Gram-positive bacteria) TaxID=84139 RepID=UPI003C706B4F